MGPLYQGRFKSLPVQADEHLLTLLRYVQRNPVRAKLAPLAGQWRWCSERIRLHGPAEMGAILARWPVDRPRQWAKWVNEPQTSQEMERGKAIRECIARSRPWGDPAWTARTAKALHLMASIAPRGRPPTNQEKL
jgi:putative transposase